MAKSLEELWEAFALTKRYLKQQIEVGWDEIYLASEGSTFTGEEKNKSAEGGSISLVGQTGGVKKISSVEKQLHKFYLEIKDCTKCHLSKSRTNFVFGVGNGESKVIFIGEAPGREEDLKGEPFVGAAGKLLDKILEAIKFKREEIYIANILKCRPPENRDPDPEEIEICQPYLLKQIQIIKPGIICALGRISAQALLKSKLPLNQLRGRFHDFCVDGLPHPIRFLVTYHPAALLRYPQYKKQTWEDVQLLRKEYDRLKGY
jgi:DNA polymerase